MTAWDRTFSGEAFSIDLVPPRVIRGTRLLSPMGWWTVWMLSACAIGAALGFIY